MVILPEDLDNAFLRDSILLEQDASVPETLQIVQNLAVCCAWVSWWGCEINELDSLRTKSGRNTVPPF